MKPRIAIPVPTSNDFAYNQRSWPAYAEAVRRSGGEPVEFPLTLLRSEQVALAASCQGVLLPGSPADVEPTRYGAEREDSTSPADPAREAVDFLLLEEALAKAKPVLGICFGVQSMNVWRGGTLVQDLTLVPVNHEAGSSVAVAHAALVAPESLLGSIVDAEEAPVSGEFLRLPVNTSHHQSLGVPGEGLRVVARCPDDGVIEAVEIDPAMFHVEHPQFLLGVQWHPERSYEISATSRALFARLVAEAAKV
jgi:putative glutamine amidotransferase